jgi:hypothetical protein
MDYELALQKVALMHRMEWIQHRDNYALGISSTQDNIATDYLGTATHIDVIDIKRLEQLLLIGCLVALDTEEKTAGR